MASFRTQYTRLNSGDDPDEDLPPQGFHLGTRGLEEIEKGRWNHIEDLDEFFIRVYDYHRKDGFACILLSEFFELVQFVFIVLFTSFLVQCVDYDAMFHYKNPTFSQVVHFHKVKHMEPALVACHVVAFLFWLIRLIRIVIYFFKLLEIRSFYKHALRITESELINMQWGDVQKRLIEVQQVHQMCVHKEELTELDIHHRILRWKNYMIAMQNKSIIPCNYNFPLIGPRTFLTEGMKYNLKTILFWGPGCPFKDNWKLRSEYKNTANRHTLAESLSRRIFWIGVANFLLAPFILLWVVLYSFFKYAEVVKREPHSFGARRWSPYGRLFLRHFNELDHEFQTRLSKAYEPSVKYMNLFTSPLVAIVAKNVAFFAGSIVAVLTMLTLLDQDVLMAENVLMVIAVLGLLIRGCYIFIPSEELVWNPEQLMKQIVSIIHYMPDGWKGKAFTTEIPELLPQVREQFAQLFQYKAVYVLEELLSPVVTPFLLCFTIRHKALDIVDFFRNFTVEVVGVGDVCSFAQMDVKKHGNPEWLSHGLTEATQYEQAENGKTELSLLHFSIKNPTWRPSEGGARFIDTIRENAVQDGLNISGSTALSEPNSLPQYLSAGSGFHGLPYMHPMSLSDPSGVQFPSLAQAHEPQAQQQTDALMNNSMMYMYQLRDRHSDHGLHHVTTMAGSSAQRRQQEDTGASPAGEYVT